MGGEHGQSAALQVRADQADDDADRRRIKRHVGLIENPQGLAVMHQARQGGPAFLPLRQVATGEILAAGKAEGLQRLEGGVLVERLLSQMRGAEQVFQRAQLIFDRVGVPEVEDFAPVGFAQTADRLALPADFARHRR